MQLSDLPLGRWSAAAALGVLYPAFLLATAAGLLSGLPGGIGAFEVVLLAALTVWSLAESAPCGTLAAGLAWRALCATSCR